MLCLAELRKEMLYDTLLSPRLILHRYNCMRDQYAILYANKVLIYYLLCNKKICTLAKLIKLNNYIHLVVVGKHTSVLQFCTVTTAQTNMYLFFIILLVYKMICLSLKIF